MAKRTRSVMVTVYYTEQEWAVVAEKMKIAGVRNSSSYLRRMSMTGEVKYYDFSNLKELSAILGRLAGSINQVAKRCNETGSVSKNDVEQLRREYLQVKAVCQERLIKMLRKL